MNEYKATYVWNHRSEIEISPETYRYIDGSAAVRRVLEALRLFKLGSSWHVWIGLPIEGGRRCGTLAPNAAIVDIRKSLSEINSIVVAIPLTITRTSLTPCSQVNQTW